MADLGKFHNEVMVEILWWVPPECLARFKCVSKSWYALINDPNFCGYLKNQNILLERTVMNNEDQWRESRLCFLKYPLTADEDSSFDVEDFHLPRIVEVECPYLKIIGHSQGIVCLSGNIHIFLYNPTTREIRKLPHSILHFETKRQDFYSTTIAIRDLKVVSVVDFPSYDDMLVPGKSRRFQYPEYKSCLCTRVEVYDLKKDKWREIETSVSARVYRMRSFEMFYQGFYYWWGVTRDGKAEVILCFDISEELFGQIPVPESFNKGDCYERSLGVLNESIVVFHYYHSSGWGKVKFDIWEMNKFEGLISWSKLLTIGPIPDMVPTPVSFVSSDQLLIETSRKELVLFNINTQHVKHLPLQSHWCVCMVGFVKTLHSLNTTT